MTRVPKAERHPTGRTILAALAAVWALGALPAPAAAYIGPGAALSLLGAFWGVLVAVAAAIGFALAWPIRRYLRMRRERKASEKRVGPSPATSSAHHARAGTTDGAEQAADRVPYSATEA